jgi:hypothetical protein
MNSTKENDQAAVLVLVLGGAAVLFGIVWTFSETLSLDINSGGVVLGDLILLAICIWGLSKVLEPADILPGALAGLWACFWPALTWWASSPFPRGHGGYDDVVWWAAWYTKLGVLLGILLIGYGWRWWQRWW